MNTLIEFLIVKPFAALAKWARKHPVIAVLVWLVLWFLPPLGVVLYALATRAVGESIGKLFIETRWARIALTLIVTAVFPPVGVVLLSWVLLDMFKPDDRVTTRTIAEIIDEAKAKVSGIFNRTTSAVTLPDPANEDLPTVPPPNPVVDAEVSTDDEYVYEDTEVGDPFAA